MLGRGTAEPRLRSELRPLLPGAAGCTQRAMQNLPLTLFVLAVGGALTFQALANAEMGRVGRSPLTGAIINFVVGMGALALLYISGVLGKPQWSELRSAPWWAWLGGLVGATFITTMIVAVPRIGAVTAFTAIILGQLTASATVDSFGLLGAPITPLSVQRLLGLSLIAAGALLTQR